ncbi:uncharacterized protein [Anabrus simplex]|uniref:uncharacterized protein n=1 Tax=Anabrus simplex TaxID=316456 RepID=UPI0035A297C9
MSDSHRSSPSRSLPRTPEPTGDSPKSQRRSLQQTPEPVHDNDSHMKRSSIVMMINNHEDQKIDSRAGIDNPGFQEDEPQNTDNNGSIYVHMAPGNGITNNGPYLNNAVDTSMLTEVKLNNGSIERKKTKKDKEVAEAVNLELVNMKPYTGEKQEVTNGVNGIPIKKESDEVDLSSSYNDSYDEYFVPVNEHRKYMRGEKLYVTKDKRRSQSWKRCACWGIGLVLLAIAILIAALAGTGVILAQEEPIIGSDAARQFGSGTTESQPESSSFTPPPPSPESPGQPPTTDMSALYVPRVLEGHLVLDNKEFMSELLDPNSPQFQTLARQLEEELMTSLFDLQTRQFGASDINLKVYKFAPGSVVVYYYIAWVFKEGIRNAPDPITKDAVRQRLEHTLSRSNGFLGSDHHVVSGSIVANHVIDVCQLMNGGCSHGCMFDYNEAANFICTCPSGLVLDRDGKNCTDKVQTTVEEPSVSRVLHPDAVNYPEPEGNPEPEANPEPSPEPEASPEPSPELAVIPESDTSAEPEPTPEPGLDSDHSLEPGVSPEPAAEPGVSPEPSAEPGVSPEPSAEPGVSPEPSAEPGVSPEPTPEPGLDSDHSLEPGVSPEPSAEPGVSPEPSPVTEMVTKHHQHPDDHLNHAQWENYEGHHHQHPGDKDEEEEDEEEEEGEEEDNQDYDHVDDDHYDDNEARGMGHPDYEDEYRDHFHNAAPSSSEMPPHAGDNTVHTGHIPPFVQQEEDETTPQPVENTQVPDTKEVMPHKHMEMDQSLHVATDMPITHNHTSENMTHILTPEPGSTLHEAMMSTHKPDEMMNMTVEPESQSEVSQDGKEHQEHMHDMSHNVMVGGEHSNDSEMSTVHPDISTPDTVDPHVINEMGMTESNPPIAAEDTTGMHHLEDSTILPKILRDENDISKNPTQDAKNESSEVMKESGRNIYGNSAEEPTFYLFDKENDTVLNSELMMNKNESAILDTMTTILPTTTIMDMDGETKQSDKNIGVIMNEHIDEALKSMDNISEPEGSTSAGLTDEQTVNEMMDKHVSDIMKELNMTENSTLVPLHKENQTQENRTSLFDFQLLSENDTFINALSPEDYENHELHKPEDNTTEESSYKHLNKAPRLDDDAMSEKNPNDKDKPDTVDISTTEMSHLVSVEDNSSVVPSELEKQKNIAVLNEDSTEEGVEMSSTMAVQAETATVSMADMEEENFNNIHDSITPSSKVNQLNETSVESINSKSNENDLFAELPASVHSETSSKSAVDEMTTAVTPSSEITTGSEIRGMDEEMTTLIVKNEPAVLSSTMESFVNVSPSTEEQHLNSSSEDNYIDDTLPGVNFNKQLVLNTTTEMVQMETTSETVVKEENLSKNEFHNSIDGNVVSSSAPLRDEESKPVVDITTIKSVEEMESNSTMLPETESVTNKELGMEEHHHTTESQNSSMPVSTTMASLSNNSATPTPDENHIEDEQFRNIPVVVAKVEDGDEVVTATSSSVKFVSDPMQPENEIETGIKTNSTGGEELKDVATTTDSAIRTNNNDLVKTDTSQSTEPPKAIENLVKSGEEELHNISEIIITTMTPSSSPSPVGNESENIVGSRVNVDENPVNASTSNSTENVAIDVNESPLLLLPQDTDPAKEAFSKPNDFSEENVENKLTIEAGKTTSTTTASYTSDIHGVPPSAEGNVIPPTSQSVLLLDPITGEIHPRSETDESLNITAPVTETPMLIVDGNQPSENSTVDIVDQIAPESKEEVKKKDLNTVASKKAIHSSGDLATSDVEPNKTLIGTFEKKIGDKIQKLEKEHSKKVEKFGIFSLLDDVPATKETENITSTEEPIMVLGSSTTPLSEKLAPLSLNDFVTPGLTKIEQTTPPSSTVSTSSESSITTESTEVKVAEIVSNLNAVDEELAYKKEKKKVEIESKKSPKLEDKISSGNTALINSTDDQSTSEISGTASQETTLTPLAAGLEPAVEHEKPITMMPPEIRVLTPNPPPSDVDNLVHEGKPIEESSVTPATTVASVMSTSEIVKPVEVTTQRTQEVVLTTVSTAKDNSSAMDLENKTSINETSSVATTTTESLDSMKNSSVINTELIAKLNQSMNPAPAFAQDENNLSSNIQDLSLESRMGDMNLGQEGNISGSRVKELGQDGNLTAMLSSSLGFSKCAAVQFQCINGTSREGAYCVPLSAKCDSVRDCSDGSDEDGCVEKGCTGNFQCSNGQCLKRHLVCNGIVDCNDGSDEINCDSWKCEFDEFQCPSGRCIPVLWQCDGKPDCSNHTDEFNCQSSCGNDEYLCPEGWCIPMTWRCNGEMECANGDDEKLCECSLDQFRCNTGGCVPKSQVCDGVEHCPDFSDEWNCVRLHNDTMKLQIRSADDTWHPVCADKWDSDWSDLACQNLGYSKATFTEKPTGPEDNPAASDVGFYRLKDRAGAVATGVGSRLAASLEKPEDNATCTSASLLEISCQDFTCGIHSTAYASRVVGGDGATNGQWPSVALLYHTRHKTSCTASIISPKWLLSSYNCLHLRDKQMLPTNWVAFGGGSMFEVDKPETQIREVQNIVPYPQVKYNQFLFNNDIALIELSQPLQFTRYVGAICLPEKDIEPRQLCVTAGWGYTSPGEINFSQYLHYLPIPTIDLADCNSTKHYAGFITENEICAGYTDAERSPCYNDEGAPLMCISEGGVWELQGVLSYHSNCGRGYHPSIFSSITAVRSWVEKTVGSRFERKSTYNVRRRR